MDIQWYSMSRDLEVEVHEAIGLDEAIKIVDRYLSRAGMKFESGEEALSQTMFGFCHSDSEFIEIGVDGLDQISYKFEVPEADGSWFRKLFSGVFQHEEELHSRDELVQKVSEFFTTPPQEIKLRLANS